MGISDIDWETVFQMAAFSPAEVQFLLLHKIAGIPAADVATTLGWPVRRLDAIRKRSDRHVARLANYLRGFVGYRGDTELLFLAPGTRGQQIKRLRKLLKFNQTGLAAAAGMSIKTVQRAERDDASNESGDRIIRILLSECDRNQVRMRQEQNARMFVR